MADDRTLDGYRSYESDFRSHHSDTYGSTKHEYGFYESAYRHGYRYGAQSEHRDRDYDALEKELRRDYEREHGDGTFGDVREAVRYGFRRGRHHQGERHGHRDGGSHGDDTGVKGPSGSSQTASGDPGSAVRQSE